MNDENDLLGGKRGIDVIHDPLLNKGTAFTEEERERLGLRGLLPPRMHDQQLQKERVLENLRRKTSDLEKYIYMVSLQERNEHLFYRVLVDNLEELMPIVYTPTVGLACQRYAHIFRRPRGLYVSQADRGRVAEVLRNWPQRDVRVMVITDGERILGLGDLGANGMGIPVGKLSLYTACAGIHPRQCLPVTIDVGTNNRSLLDDPLYFGLQRERLRGEDYEALIDEFLRSAAQLFPRAVLQLEDFGNANAFRLLTQYRDSFCLFDDDIQGTAAVALAGLYSALRITGGTLADQRVLFMGAGEAGIGTGELIIHALRAEGLAEREARQRCWFFDSHGLVVAERTDLSPHKLPFAHAHPPAADFAAAIEALQPTAIIGVSGQAGAFSQESVRAMARINRRPIVFALSNPTEKAECTAEQAYAWSEGRAIFASGSPFAPVDYQGQRYVPGQGNNVYIFPGVGLGVVASAARAVTDEMFFTSARTLASLVSESDLAQGRVYPELPRIREVSTHIAIAIAELAYDQGLARNPRPGDIAADVRACIFEPNYPRFA
ncbi:MAG: NAD-dependent malic enzyme [Deltaproteobacteria bacterium]|nr:NAD-dependent malic enzyme [Deltaproteobacteria bacterium]